MSQQKPVPVAGKWYIVKNWAGGVRKDHPPVSEEIRENTGDRIVEGPFDDRQAAVRRIAELKELGDLVAIEWRESDETAPEVTPEKLS